MAAFQQAETVNFHTNGPATPKNDNDISSRQVMEFRLPVASDLEHDQKIMRPVAEV